MRVLKTAVFAASLVMFLNTPIAEAKPISMVDFPLRVQIYHRQVRRHYFRHFLQSVSGTGRGNLYENHEARGIDFVYDCSGSFMDSSGPESYPARWVKPGQTIEIMVGEIRHPDKAWTCSLDVQEKEFAYKKRTNGTLASVPVDEYKRWMESQHYDPESGSDVPLAQK